MSVPYNPFELLNLPLIKELLRKNTNFLVVQRLQWPGIPNKKGFIATPYQQQKAAREHEQKLDSNEGRMIDLQFELDKILALIESPKYLLFLNAYRDLDWQDKILKHYQKNILSKLEISTQIQAIEDVSIDLSFKFGKLTASIQFGESIQEFGLLDLIK
ncbi:hypothetical protein ACFP1I_12830 [Dyadobacter subterraneus]|uniref:Uncharacterized protein n=1 Tax=Dyadobacter subterraneus TaxID=2773304 RepID=A0ABR9W9I2_9BACT|nr:hypothetical protein [Dyadobacter subterraneus]MBE9462115.1 hypothetical protein [Dyadobacter subterraneus]